MTVRIVCLDGYTANPGDLDWAPFAKLGRFECHDRTDPADVVARARGAECVLTNKTVLAAETLAALPELGYIGVLATGYNVVDIEAARQRGIVVTNVPSYSTEAVAQHTIALLLEWASRVGAHDRAVHAGRWANQSPDFSFTVAPTRELAGRTIGLVGLGDIGQAVARLATALGMKVIASNRSGRAPELPAGVDVEMVKMDELFAQADVVSLHCPLTEQTRRLVGRERLSRMKPGAFLINTARGPLVDEAALAEALATGRLAGAAVDVLFTEPPRPDTPLLAAPNCIITPHIAWCARDARRRLIAIAAANLEAYLNGRPVNQVT